MNSKEENEKAKLMYLGQHKNNILLRLNRNENNLNIELDESGMSTILEKMIEIRGINTIKEWCDQIQMLTEDGSEEEEWNEIEGINQ